MFRNLSLRALLIAGVTTVLMQAQSRSSFPDPVVRAPETGTQKAVLSGGCFWGVQGVFERVKGVKKAVAGYAGGDKSTAQYEIVSTGNTGHAESVEITYDPAQVTYGQLLKIYFSVVTDPTELNRQGPDTGTQYRSAIFYMNDEQKRVAEAYIDQLNAAQIFSKKIVTQVVPYKGFYPAEDYHQHFLDKHPTYPYIAINDMPKVAALKKNYPQMCKR
ncbi:MAG TPA: peptide-methionine (S)-S-oxide reductase MsrA [Bryobacteraceae bacterium]